MTLTYYECRRLCEHKFRILPVGATTRVTEWGVTNQEGPWEGGANLLPQLSAPAAGCLEAGWSEGRSDCQCSKEWNPMCTCNGTHHIEQSLKCISCIWSRYYPWPPHLGDQKWWNDGANIFCFKSVISALEVILTLCANKNNSIDFCTKPNFWKKISM